MVEVQKRREFFESFGSGKNSPLVQTTHGKVRGQGVTTLYGDFYYAFESIPYAKPPLGPLRFKAPQPAESWQGVLDGTRRPPACLQLNRHTKQIEGQEDCLYLNVYAKKLKSTKPLPVMVYVYGGGFTTGYPGDWGPDYFMMQDIVLINMTFRGGVFGFLSFDDPAVGVPGNAGIKDVVLALQWIKQNCAYFNGDPHNITLFGHSSGSALVHALMLSERCRGLFHKAIPMAGLATHCHSLPHLPYRLAKYLGFEGENTDKQVFEFLSATDGSKLVDYGFWTPEELRRGNWYAFMMTVEPYETPDAILLRQPHELYANAWGNRIPIMLGATSKEALIQYKRLKENPNIFKLLSDHPEYLAPADFKGSCSEAEQKRAGQRLLSLHFGSLEVSAEHIDPLIELYSYFMYHSIYRVLKSRIRAQAARTFLYRFDFDSASFNLYRIKHNGPQLRGVGHVDELSYLFLMPTSFKLDKDTAEYRTILRMVGLWATFAATSNPNSALIRPIVWRAIDQTGQRPQCLNIADNISFIDWPEEALCRKWDEIYAEFRLNDG